jgi:hypothetical protein
MVIVAAFALLALFSIFSIILSAEDQDRLSDPRENPYLWTFLGRR